MRFWKRKPPDPYKDVVNPATFDYRSKRLGWGHNLMMTRIPDLNGWWRGHLFSSSHVEFGDFVLRDGVDGETLKYRVAEVACCGDPWDMYRVTLQFVGIDNEAVPYNPRGSSWVI